MRIAWEAGPYVSWTHFSSSGPAPVWGWGWWPGSGQDTGFGTPFWSSDPFFCREEPFPPFLPEDGSVATITGGEGDDAFWAGVEDEVIDGGGGNDAFYSTSFRTGTDLFLSRLDDADTFVFATDQVGFTSILGFNGQGSTFGDAIEIIDFDASGVGVIERGDGTTLFDWGEGQALVDAVGLVPGIDYLVA